MLSSRYRPRTIRSMPHVLRVERLRLVGVVSAFDDRPAVGEDGELVLVHIELEHELVEAHAAQGAEVAGHRREIELAGDALAHLHGVSAAKARRLRPVSAVEPFELPLTATEALHL